MTRRGRLRQEFVGAGPNEEVICRHPIGTACTIIHDYGVMRGRETIGVTFVDGDGGWFCDKAIVEELEGATA